MCPTWGPRIPPERTYLIVFEGGASSTFALDEGRELVIGRAENADVHLDHPSVSRRHARIRVRAEIEDLGSHNGTRVNGEQPRLAFRSAHAVAAPMLEQIKNVHRMTAMLAPGFGDG